MQVYLFFGYKNPYIRWQNLDMQQISPGKYFFALLVESMLNVRDNIW